MPAKGVNRGGSKALHGGKTLPRASKRVVESARQALESRLSKSTAMIGRLDRHIVKLTAKVASPKNPPTIEKLEELKKRVDVAVKLRESWERTERRCQVSLGIVTERAARKAAVTAIKDDEDELGKIQEQFE